MGTIVVSGFVATSDPIAAYGGVRIGPGEMEGLAQAMCQEEVPLRLRHDDRLSTRARLLVAEVRPTDSGALGVWVELEVDEDEWAAYGDIRGFSVAVVQPHPVPPNDESKPRVGIYPDAGHFDEQTLQAAIDELQQRFSVHAGYLYQFADLPPAKLLIEFTWATLQAMPPQLIASAFYDVLKSWFLRPKHADKTIFSFRVRRPGQEVRARLETNDPQVLQEALVVFRDVALSSSAGDVLEFDADAHEWKSLQQ